MRIALATPPFPASIDDAMGWVAGHVEEAARAGAAIVCFPESYVPGLRGIGLPVEAHSPDRLRAALETACALARRHGIGVILPMDRDHPGGIQNAACVISAEGRILGWQTKNQLDPTEDAVFVPGTERSVFRLGDLTFGVVICHEGFRYPESVRWAARRGAQVVFHPHCTGTDAPGRRLTEWRGANNPYYESAVFCRAMENDVYVASVNYAFAFQESASCVVAPGGACVARLPYGEAGVLVADLDLTRATGRLAGRFRPELYP